MAVKYLILTRPYGRTVFWEVDVSWERGSFSNFPHTVWVSGSCLLQNKWVQTYCTAFFDAAAHSSRTVLLDLIHSNRQWVGHLPHASQGTKACVLMELSLQSEPGTGEVGRNKRWECWCRGTWLGFEGRQVLDLVSVPEWGGLGQLNFPLCL